MKAKKAWKLLLVAALTIPALGLSTRPADSCPWPPCEQVCRYFFPAYYCYYDECCHESCCDWGDWTCVNPCSP